MDENIGWGEPGLIEEAGYAALTFVPTNIQ